MFSRRAIQGLVDHLCPIITTQEHQNLVARLNRPGRDKLAALWELVAITGLSRVGGILHEKALPSGRRPDIRLSVGGESFTADVTTVSDASYHKANPVDAFSREFDREVRKAKLDPNHFHLQVEGAPDANKSRLRLPSADQHAAFLKRHIAPFLRQIKQSKRARDTLRIEQSNVSLSIDYDRSQRFSTMGYFEYRYAGAVDRNPLWSALEKKEAQLRSAKDTKRGIIACDGGSRLLQLTTNPGTQSR